MQTVSFRDLPPKVQQTYVKVADWPILHDQAVIVAYKQGRAWKLGCLRKDSSELKINPTRYFRIIQ